MKERLKALFRYWPWIVAPWILIGGLVAWLLFLLWLCQPVSPAIYVL